MSIDRDPPLVLGDVREGRDPGHVADGPDAVGCTAALVDGDAAALGLDADGLEAEVGRARAPADRP